MATTWTLPLALLLASGLAAQSSNTLIVHFPLASSELNADDEAALRALCDRADITRVIGITLKGHTDIRGTAEYNAALSERRAEAVRTALRATCLKDRAVVLDWSGETQPLARGGSEEDHAANRRVEVLLSYRKSFTNAALATAPGVHHPKVTPLMPTADKQQETRSVDPAHDIDLIMADGTRLRIAANAITDINGNVVDGDVELHYRSFLDPYEIIASGIPMHLNTPEGVEHFETAGMFELYATKDGERLMLAAREHIELTPAGTASLTDDYGPYLLDENTGAWVSGGTLTTRSAAPQTPIATRLLATEATAIYWARMAELSRDELTDSTLFAARRASPSYCHLMRCDQAVGARKGIFKKSIERIFPQSVAGITIKGYKGIYEEHDPVFVVSMDQTDDIAFPEWRRLPYKAVWRYAGTENRAAFKRLFGGQHLYQDIALEMEPGSTTGTLRLKENGSWVELPVSAELNIHSEREAERWRMALEAYDRALAKRTIRFDRYVTQAARRYQVRHANVRNTSWRAAKPRMNDTEAPMDLEAWHAYALPRKPRTSIIGDSTQQAAYASIETTFNLDGFGIHNIDRIMKMPEQQQVLATTEGADGAAFPWVSAYAVLRTERSVITYWGNGTGVKDAMLVSPGRMKSLFLVDAQGNIAHCDVAPLNSWNARATLRWTLLEQPGDINDVKEVASVR